MKPDAVFLAFRSKEITKRTIDKIIPLLPSEDIVIQAWGEKAMRWSWRRTVSIGFENDPLPFPEALKRQLDALLQEVRKSYQDSDEYRFRISQAVNQPQRIGRVVLRTELNKTETKKNIKLGDAALDKIYKKYPQFLPKTPIANNPEAMDIALALFM
mmetsp:Transcript_28586/g.40298  ORF Transcript_28586/g.40298 Transcript_28586/m.40298 type:complete len:157 (-) Transcript_28586:489-959(-)